MRRVQPWPPFFLSFFLFLPLHANWFFSPFFFLKRTLLREGHWDIDETLTLHNKQVCLKLRCKKTGVLWPNSHRHGLRQRGRKSQNRVMKSRFLWRRKKQLIQLCIIIVNDVFYSSELPLKLYMQATLSAIIHQVRSHVRLLSKEDKRIQGHW